MKKIFIVTLIFLLLTTACGENDAIESTEKGSMEKGASLSPWSEYAGGLTEPFQDELKEIPDATEYVIDLTITENMQSITGHQKATYTNLEDTNLKEIYFRLFSNASGGSIDVTNVTVDSEIAETNLEHKKTALRVVLLKTLSPGETVQVEMDFTATVPTDMGGNYGLYVYTDEILALDKFHPFIPVYNHEGWNVEDPPINADMIFTDVAFYDVTVHAQEDLVIVASGTVVETQTSKGNQHIRFIGGPQRDFYITASTRFVSASKMAGDTLVTSYFPPEYEELGKLVLDTGVDALQIFSGRYGAYPYTELDLVSTPMSAGGMEYAGAAAIQLFYYDPSVSIRGLPGRVFLESATAHEVAHQWFFNQIMNDQIDEPWLDEGLAQYLTSIYYLDKYGSDAAISYRTSWEGVWGRVDFADIPIGKPARDYSEEEYGPIIYGRAPFFVRELEMEIGSEIFTSFLEDYVEKYRWKTVGSEDFIGMVEKACECDLDELFDNWWRIE